MGNQLPFMRVTNVLIASCFFAGVSYLEAVIHHVPWFCTVTTVLIWLPQVYWFGLMYNGCVKVLRGPPKQNPKLD